MTGETLGLNIYDPALLYGATVFTTLRVYQSSLQHPLTGWTAHCDRLRSSLDTFGWQYPDWQQLKKGAEALLTHYPVLRLMVLADGREWILGRMLPEDLRQRQTEGVTAWLADDSLFGRSLAAYKTGNYLGAWLALQKAQELGAKEAILMDNQGNWLENGTGNLWGWQGGCWWTPPLTGDILPGIVRSHLLQYLEAQNLPVKQAIWHPDLVKEFEAIAYTNCVMEVIPFNRILMPEETLKLNPFHGELAQLRAYFEQNYNDNQSIRGDSQKKT
jgi:4-amino-4-deoxychorismate lyase